jgi:hypothetical protein
MPTLAVGMFLRSNNPKRFRYGSPGGYPMIARTCQMMALLVLAGVLSATGCQRQHPMPPPKTPEPARIERQDSRPTTPKESKTIDEREAIRIAETAVRKARGDYYKDLRLKSSASREGKRWMVFVVPEPQTAPGQNNLVELSDEGEVLIIHPGA